MTYYFGVKETDQHDYELEIIEADTLKQAKEMFTQDHPEDVPYIDYINEENSICNLL